jgi:hypothetical protein
MGMALRGTWQELQTISGVLPITVIPTGNPNAISVVNTHDVVTLRAISSFNPLITLPLKRQVNHVSHGRHTILGDLPMETIGRADCSTSMRFSMESVLIAIWTMLLSIMTSGKNTK